jgi:hypothetical protein
MIDGALKRPLELALAEAVNAEFYAFAYGELPHGETAAAHYLGDGWREGRDPNPWFCTRTYLEANPDVSGAELNPLVHFLQAGAAEGRDATPSVHAAAFYDRSSGWNPKPSAPPRRETRAADRPSSAEEHEYHRRVCNDEFNEDFYLTINPDVFEAGVDPLTHFLQNGWREGRDPNAYFSVRGYLDANVDVAEAGINPFFHFLAAGRAEGRPERLELGFRYDVLANLRTLEQRMAEVPPVPYEELGTQAELRTALGSLRRSGKQRLHLSVSHDDFTANIGGLQFCLSREAQSFRRIGADHIHLFPARPLLVTNAEESDPAIGVLINGSLTGYFAATSIASALTQTDSTYVGPMWSERSFAIHSCLGHNTEALADILRSLNLKRGFFWVHDFASVCTGYSLMRNDVAFCGAPPPESTACEVCVYGGRRQLQVADHARLFAEFDLTVVAPSLSAMMIWKASSSLRPLGEIVHPHCRLRPRSPRALPPPSDRIKVAFLGYRNAHKGWDLFRELVQRYGRDGRYEFHHLGLLPMAGLPVEFTPVAVTDNDPNAMMRAVESLGIDVAVIWALWPETFCFTAYEAIAGGATLLTSSSSGNVAALTRETGLGLVLDDEEDLYALFGSGEVARFARQNREVAFYSLEYTGMTADLVEGAGT